MAPVPRKRRAAAAAAPSSSRPTKRVTPPSSSSKRVPSVASVIAADVAKRKAAAVQVNLPFAKVDRFPVGIKLLLPDTIYPNAASVSPSLLLSNFVSNCLLTLVSIVVHPPIDSRSGTRGLHV